MKTHTNRTVLALAVAMSLTTISTAMAGSEHSSFQAHQITVPSEKSFEQVTDAVKSLVTKSGMMVLGEVDQGKILSMTGLKVKAHLFLVGNPTIGKKLFEQVQAVGLYVPFRVFVYNDEDGKTFVSYDQPSTLLSQFDNDEVTMVGRKLDEKLSGLATMAAN